MRKRYYLIPLTIVIAISGIWFWACNHPWGDGIPKNTGDIEQVIEALTGSGGGLAVYNNSYTLPKNSLSQDEQDAGYDPDINKTVLFGSGRKIPALTVTSNGVILAAAGVTNNGPFTVRRSSDMGKTWSTVTVVSSSSGSAYINPFFINCHNGDILLGVVSNKQTIIYRSTSDGQTWQQETNIDTNTIDAQIKVKDCFVTYGQGITLRHGKNSGQNNLMFPYWYNNNTNGNFTAPMFSSDDGKNFTNGCTTFSGNLKVIGQFRSYETKLIELSDGNILLNVRNSFGTSGNTVTWIKSTDNGKNWDWPGANYKNRQDNNDDARHADLVRYEFNGKDIKENGSKYALVIYSSFTESGYSVRMTTNDFNNGATGNKYHYTRELAKESANQDGYPAITVLPDGTIATLTEENENNIVFRRFNLSWLTYEAEKIDYTKDLKN